MWKDNSSIQTKFLTNMIFIALVSIGLWSLVWIQGEYSTFKSESESLRSGHIKKQKFLLKKEVRNVVKYINGMKRLSKQKLESALKERVDEAHKIAMNIYHQNIEKDLPEIKKMIKDALRPIRFNDGRGYYFAVSMKGVEQLYPVRPEFEGKNLTGLQDLKGNFVIQDEIEVIKKKTAGFVKHFWTKPGKDPSITYPKISFVKYFKPMDWYFGAGDYLDDFEKQVKKEVLNHIVELRFESEGYFFGSTFKGKPLFSNGKVTMGTGSVWNLTDPNGVKIIQEQIKTVENPGSGFVYYSWNKLNTQIPSPKISFVQGIPEWEWTIGAGVYLDTIEKIISKNKAALNIGVKKRMIRSLLILAVLLCLIYYWSKRTSNQVQQSIEAFSLFLEKASIDSMTINPNNIQIHEFKTIAISTNKMLKDRKQAKKALKESELKLKTLMNATKDVAFLAESDGTFLAVNDALAKSFGKKKEELVGRKMFEFFSTEIAEKKMAIIQKVLDSKESLHGEDNRAEKYFDYSVYPILDDNGNVKQIGVFSRNITERKQAEADRDLLLAAIEQVVETIVITNIDGNIQYANSAFEQVTGYSRKEVLGKNPRILKSGEHDPSFYRQLWQAITKGDTWQGRLINRKKDGRFYTEKASISPVLDEAGEIVNFVAVKRDITHEIRMEEKLRQAQKMETIGTLAGGIAHDFNNILFPIVGHTEMLLEDVPEDSPFHTSLNEIYISAIRAKELVKQILAFSRQEKSELKLIKIQYIVKEVLKLIRSSIPTTIGIKQDIKTDCGVIKANPTQIHQIIMNLTTNAYHAMEETGGELKVSLNEVRLGEYDRITPDMEPGSYACLSVADTGIGMDKKITDQIFDPFFTTKEKGKGTGMGLSVVHGIVKSMGGTIQVYSEPGKGTQFHVYFPIEKSSFEKLNIQTEELVQRGAEQILLVDDEEAIITMEKQMLDRLGYQVTSRTSSIEALEAFRANPDKFDLVITDMAMPNMSGDKLAVELTQIRSDIPILLCTGFSETMSEEKAASIGIKGFILKPIVMKDLSQKIREVLDRKKQ